MVSLVALTIGAVMTALASSGQRHLRLWNAARRSDLGHAIDHLVVCFGGFPEQSLVSIIGLGADAGVVPIPGQPSAPAGSTE
jgi:hypothetical protein